MISDRTKYLIDFCIGDGHISHYPGSRGGTYHYKLTHSYKQREYLQHKIDILTELGFTGNLHRFEKALNGKLFPMMEYKLHADPDLNTVYKHLINKGRKAIDRHLLSVLDARSLAYWYMDDGSPNKTNRSSSSPGNGYRYYYTYPVQKLSQIRLYTYQFSEDEHRLIQEWLYEKFNIASCLVHAKRDGLYIKISDMEQRQRFIETIRPYIPYSMLYKISGLSSFSGIEPIEITKIAIDTHGKRLNEETPTDFSEEDATVQEGLVDPA